MLYLPGATGKYDAAVATYGVQLRAWVDMQAGFLALSLSLSPCLFLSPSLSPLPCPLHRWMHGLGSFCRTSWRVSQLHSEAKKPLVTKPFVGLRCRDAQAWKPSISLSISLGPSDLLL